MAENALPVDGKDVTLSQSIADELKRLSDRAEEVEDLLRGASGVLHAIEQGGMFASLPADEAFHKDHLAAEGMLELLRAAINGHFERMRESESLSSAIYDLAFKVDPSRLGAVA